MAIDDTEVKIINQAFNRLGVRRMTTAQKTTPTTKQSRLAVDSYEAYRDEVLQDHPWNFATFRASLTKNVATPVYDYSYEYDLPDGSTPAGKPACLRVLDVNEQPLWEWRESGWYLYSEQYNTQAWKVENGRILSDSNTPLEIRYIGLVTLTTSMTPMFMDVLSAYLAVEWCESLTTSDSLSDRLEARLHRKLTEARTIDGQEGIPDSLETSYWLSGRGT